MIAPDDVIVTLDRNYNKKSAKIKLNSDDGLMMGGVWYPVGWRSGLVVSGESLETIGKIQKPSEIKVTWINQTLVEMSDNIPGANKWIVGNAEHLFGLLRVNYDLQNWRLLIQTLVNSPTSIPEPDRIQLIDDLFYLTHIHALPIRTALSLLAYLPHEPAYLPWHSFTTHLTVLLHHISDDPLIYSQLRTHLIRLFQSTYHRLKWGEEPNESLDQKQIRILVVDILCRLDYTDCVDNSVKQLTDSIKINVYNIPQHLAKSIYCTAIRYTGISEWLYLWKYYVQLPETSAMKQPLLYSLSCSSHVWVLNLFVQKLLYEKALPLSELPVVLDYIGENPVGRYVAWNLVSQDYQEFYDRIGNDRALFLKVIQVATRQFKFKYEVKQFYDFVEDLRRSNISLAYSEEGHRNKLVVNVEERIGRYAAWKTANAGPLNDWLQEQQTQVDQMTR